MRKCSFIVAIALLLCGTITAQERQYQPTCRMCPASFIEKGEIDAYVKRAIANQLIDQQIRAVDIGKINLDVGVVYRSRQDKPGEVAEHDLVSELYHVLDGSATLVTSPELEGAERRPSNLATVRLLNGPGNNAKSVLHPVVHELKAGDVVIIPAGTGHQFTRIDDHISYLMVRIDPDKVTPNKTAAQSTEDLKGDGRTTAGGGVGATPPPSTARP